MKINMYSEDVELLKELFPDHSVHFFKMHEKYKLSPGQLGRTINKFEKLKFIKVNGSEIKLSKFGRNWIFQNRRSIYLNNSCRYWKDIPSNMLLQKPKKMHICMSDFFSNTTEITRFLEDGK